MLSKLNLTVNACWEITETKTCANHTICNIHQKTTTKIKKKKKIYIDNIPRIGCDEYNFMST